MHGSPYAAIKVGGNNSPLYATRSPTHPKDSQNQNTKGSTRKKSSSVSKNKLKQSEWRNAALQVSILFSLSKLTTGVGFNATDGSPSCVLFCFFTIGMNQSGKCLKFGLRNVDRAVFCCFFLRPGLQPPRKDSSVQASCLVGPVPHVLKLVIETWCQRADLQNCT